MEFISFLEGDQDFALAPTKKSDDSRNSIFGFNNFHCIIEGESFQLLEFYSAWHWCLWQY